MSAAARPQPSSPVHRLAPALLLAAAAGVARAQEAPARAVLEPLATGRLAEVALALLAVLAVIGAAAWIARRLGQGRGAGGARFRVLAALSIGPRERVVLLQVGDRQVLLGVSAGAINSLQTLTTPVSLELAAGAPPGAAGSEKGGDGPAPGTPGVPAGFATALAAALGVRRQ